MPRCPRTRYNCPVHSLSANRADALGVRRSRGRAELRRVRHWLNEPRLSNRLDHLPLVGYRTCETLESEIET